MIDLRAAADHAGAEPQPEPVPDPEGTGPMAGSTDVPDQQMCRINRCAGSTEGGQRVRITMADVARHAGVSKTTVSRVLNGKGDLDAGTAARVRSVIAELGYVPSSGAVGLARGRTSTVGVLVPSLTWPWMGDVLQGAVDVLEAESYGLLLFTCNRGEESMRRFATQVSAKSFDGLLVIEPEGTLDYIDGLHAKGLPVVMIDDRGHQPLFPSVATTNRAGAETAAHHLLELGRRRPVVVQGPQFGCTEERLEGFGHSQIV